MHGYQITFFTRQDRRHEGKPLGEWLIQVAKQLGLRGATVIPASEGFGKSGRIHAARFFELTDQPIEVLMTATKEQADVLFARLAAADLKLFYVKTPVEFGEIGAGEP